MFTNFLGIYGEDLKRCIDDPEVMAENFGMVMIYEILYHKNINI